MIAWNKSHNKIILIFLLTSILIANTLYGQEIVETRILKQTQKYSAGHLATKDSPIPLTRAKNDSTHEIQNIRELVINLGNHFQITDKLSSMIDEVKYVSLEETDSSLIGNIGHIVFDDDKIIVSDVGTQSVLLFTEKGQFLTRIQKRGDGPGEYNRLNNIAVDTALKRIIIGSDYKFLWFDYNGNFIKELKTTYAGANEFEVIDSQTLVIYTYFGNLDDKREKYDIYYIKDDGSVSSKFIEVFPKKINSKSMIGLFSNFSRVGLSNELLLTREYSNQILSLNSAGIHSKYKLDFGAGNLPEDYVEKSLTDFSIRSSEERVDQMLRKGMLTFAGGSVLETKKWLQVTVGTSEDRTSLLFDKTKNEVRHAFNFNLINDVDGGRYLVNRWVHSDYFVSIVYPSNLQKALEQNTSIALESIKTALSSKNQENPILRFLKIK
ncbi:MAG: 6-bladed beta-propeller [Flavobacteriaceae bacterium]|nr:6-bladed beta-propeller [Flavobacteriaceae bacterium]